MGNTNKKEKKSIWQKGKDFIFGKKDDYHSKFAKKLRETLKELNKKNKNDEVIFSIAQIKSKSIFDVFEFMDDHNRENHKKGNKNENLIQDIMQMTHELYEFFIQPHESTNTLNELHKKEFPFLIALSSRILKYYGLVEKTSLVTAFFQKVRDFYLILKDLSSQEDLNLLENCFNSNPFIFNIFSEFISTTISTTCISNNKALGNELSDHLLAW